MIVTGKEALQLIETQMVGRAGAIADALAPLDAATAVRQWLDTIRAIEEFINFPVWSVDDETLARRIHAFPLGRVMTDDFAELHSQVTKVMGADVARRFALTVRQALSLGIVYATHGIPDAMMLQNVGGAMAYFQSRRRHFVAMLYTLPVACRGTRKVERLGTLNLFAPQVEINGLALTALHNQAMLAGVFSDFHIETSAYGGCASHEFEPLDDWFLEPERVSLVEMFESGAEPPTDLEDLNPQMVFSAAETRNDSRFIEAAYREFGLVEGDYGQMATFLLKLLHHSQDDYFIDVDRATFDALIGEARSKGVRGLSAVVSTRSDYVANTNEFAPVLLCADRYLSTVTLITRFLNHWKNVCLYKSRRFQIRSGFIFEESVRRKLTEQGYEVQDVRRIDRKEFDVIALDGDVIYNVQCKNNMVDLTRVESDRKRFVRYNKYLDGYYARALAKEEAREHLLRERFSRQSVRHFVISRFPVATENPRVLAYSKIDYFRALSEAPE